MGSSAKDAANMDEQEIANFNSKITPYVGDNISGSQVNALIQLVISIDNSAISSGDLSKTVSINYKSTNNKNNTISVNASKQLKDSVGDATRKVNTGAGIYYKVKATYGDDGLIKSIKVD